MLQERQVLELFDQLHDQRTRAAGRLNRIHNYLIDDPRRPLEGLPRDTPSEVRRLVRLSRVNVLKFVVSSRVQHLFVDGYRTRQAPENHQAWEWWQANRMDARQIGINRGALSYGASYGTVLDGTKHPLIRGKSPRDMTALYGEDDEWPVNALEKTRSGWRIYDEVGVYELSDDDRPALKSSQEHGAKWQGDPVCPIVRFRDTDDLDDPVLGVVEPFTALQDQINITTFGLQVAQHYGAFKQRYVIGWLAESEDARLKASASRLMTFEDGPTDIKVGEFQQTDLKGYLESREATLRHLATVSQTPVYELTAQLVNLSADALVAAKASQQGAIAENQVVLGEAYEQALGLAGEYRGVEYDPLAYTRWKDTTARSLAQLVDALGKAVVMLGIPAEHLWDRVADAMGISQQELDKWRKTAREQDPFSHLRGDAA